MVCQIFYSVFKHLLLNRHEGGLSSKKNKKMSQIFLNAIRVNTALGGSTNAPPHLQAVARHAGVELCIDDWHQFSLSSLIDFVLAIVSALLLLLCGEWRWWKLKAELPAWKNR